jgi:uncharacterized membrane protein
MTTTQTRIGASQSANRSWVVTTLTSNRTSVPRHIPPDISRGCDRHHNERRWRNTAHAAAGAAPARSGLSENVAALLSYVLGWLTGLIFLLIDKRPYVCFHAAQSLVTFGALSIARIVLALIFGVGWWFGAHAGMRHFGLGLPLLSLLALLTFVLWILCMVKAYQGPGLRCRWPGILPRTSRNISPLALTA